MFLGNYVKYISQKMHNVTTQLQSLPTKTSLSAINCLSAQVQINDTCNAIP